MMDNIAEEVIKIKGRVERIDKKLDEGLTKPCEREIVEMIRESELRSKEYTDHQVQLIIGNTRELILGMELKIIDTINSLSNNIDTGIDNKMKSINKTIDKIEERVAKMPKEMAWWAKWAIGIFILFVPLISMASVLIYLGGK